MAGPRIAWLGPLPTSGYGVGRAAGLIVRGLADAGVDVDCFAAGERADLDPELVARRGVRLSVRRPGWGWDRWYSRTDATAHLSAQLARARAQHGLVQTLLARHRAEPYDAYYQFSQPELAAPRRMLPPVVMHPQVHAAGELTWLWKERGLVPGLRPRARLTLAAGMMGARAARQYADLRRADAVICPSEHFADLLMRQCAVPAERISLVANPVDLQRFSPGPPGAPRTKLTLLFVSFMAVRKGVEMFVELSHRLGDLHRDVRLIAVGGPRWWSDHVPLLDDVDPRVAAYDGEREPAELPAIYAAADGLLQPSHYEPFGLTLAEGLASGLPVVASDAVGAAEHVDPRCCWRFPAGNADAFEHAVRQMVGALRERPLELRRTARSEAERLFAPRDVAAQLRDVLATVRVRV